MGICISILREILKGIPGKFFGIFYENPGKKSERFFEECSYDILEKNSVTIAERISGRILGENFLTQSLENFMMKSILVEFLKESYFTNLNNPRRSSRGISGKFQSNPWKEILKEFLKMSYKLLKKNGRNH